MNALARALFFGKRGELRERALQDQLQRASALNILINAISVWNKVYLTEATKVMSEKGILQDQMLKHMSILKACFEQSFSKHAFSICSFIKVYGSFTIRCNCGRIISF